MATSSVYRRTYHSTRRTPFTPEANEQQLSKLVDTFEYRSPEPRAAACTKRKRGDVVNYDKKHMTRKACATDPEILRDFFDYSSKATPPIKKTRKRSLEAWPTKSVAFKVGTDGANYNIPLMGIRLIIPKGAVESEITLKISILAPIDNLPQLPCRWSQLSPRIKIEPDDVRYKKDVYLVINHNLNTILSDLSGPGTPLLLNRSDSDAEWEVITSNVREHENQIQGFRICSEKQAVLTPSTVIVAMKSNCEKCLITHLPEEHKNRKIMRMKLLAYADYQKGGRKLQIRAYAVHDTADRIQDCHLNEAELRGHFLGHETMYVDFTEGSGQPVSVTLRTSVDGVQLQEQTDTIGNPEISSELGRNNGPLSPYATFVVDLGQLSANPQSVVIEVSGSAWAILGSRVIKRAQDLENLVQRRQPLPSPIDSHSSGSPDSTSPVRISQLQRNRDTIIQMLMQSLSPADVEAIRRAEAIDVLDDPAYPGPSDLTFLILNQFLTTETIEDLIDKLRAAGVYRADIESKLNAGQRDCDSP